MMRIVLISFILILLGGFAWTQNLNFDSLEIVWNTPTISDSLRLSALHQIIRKKEVKENLDKALSLSEEQLEFAKEKSNLYWEARALSNIGYVYRKKEAYETALTYFFKSIELNKQNNNYKGVAGVYGNIAYLYKRYDNNYKKSIEYYLKKAEVEQTKLDSVNLRQTLYYIGYAYRSLGDFSRSLEYYLQGLEVSENRNDEEGIVIGANMIGNLFINMNDAKSAEEWLLKGLEKAKQTAYQKGISHGYNNLGNVYFSQEKYDLALSHFEKSLSMKKELNDKEGMGNTYSNLGRIYLEKKDYDKAFEYFELGLKERLDINYKRDIIESYNDYGSYYIAVEKYKDAIKWCKKGFTLSMAEKDRQIASCKCLMSAYEKSGDYKNAFDYQGLYMSLSDSIYNTVKTREIVNKESFFEYEKEKGVIIENNKEKEKNYKEKISDGLTIQYVLITLVALLGLLVYLIYRNNLNKKNANRALSEKNQQIIADKIIIEKQALELKERDEMKTRFFTHISHELRTPLTLILGPIAQMIKSKELSSKDLTYAKLIEYNAKGLLGRTNEILDLTKLDNGLLNLNNTAIYLYAVIENIIKYFHVMANPKEIKLSLDFNLDKEIQVSLDKDKLEQILNNFLSNALKYTPKKGEVNLTVEEKEGNILFSVKDNGQGIHPEDIDYVFDRFYQAKHTEVYGGTGIGLALCQELATVMNGKVWLISDLNLGSTFYFEIQLIESFENVVNSEIKEKLTITSPTIKTTNEPSLNPNPNKILLVEDNQDLCTYITMVLSDYDLTIANNGVEALDLIEAHKESGFSLVITDLMMPQMDGFTLLERLKSKKNTKNIPVIVLTARTDWEGKMNALQLGVDDYILKPFKEFELKLIIHNLLQNQKERKLALSEKEKIITKNEYSSLDGGTKKWLSKVEELVEKHKSDSQFKTAALAKTLNYSERQLRRRLKELTGLSPSKYIRIVKLQYARKLLEKGEILSVSEVAYAAGFETPQYFSRIYESEFGRKPIDYLR